MEIVSLIVQQLHAGVISLLPFAPIWFILLNLVTYGTKYAYGIEPRADLGDGFWGLKPPPLHFQALLDQYAEDYNEILS